MYKKIFGFILTQLIVVLVYSQNGNSSDCPNCKSPAMVELRTQLINQILTTPRLKAGSECDKKNVRLNIYYIQDDNGQKNFSATGNGFGGSYNGKDFAYDMIREVNKNYSNNTQLRIPPNNNISVNHKDIQFIIEGIYYIKNTALNKEIDRTQNSNGDWTVFETANSSNLAPLRQGPIDSVIHIFVQGVGKSAKKENNIWTLEDTYGGGGVCYGDIIRLGSYAKYWSFFAPSSPNINSPRSWYWGPDAGLWEHEIAHSLSLDHTVLWPWGANCPTVKFNGAGSVQTSCDDNIPDNETPSAWHMTDVLNAPIHPGERNGTLKDLHPTWWSNNSLDYNNEHAMSPLQIQLMHVYLYQQKPAWLVENAQWSNKSYCSWIGNRISHYGKNITLNKNCLSNLKVTSGTTRKVVASQSTEIFGGFEVLAGSEFEIVNTCPKP